ncbi:MAG: protein translocase subunit SecD [Oscillospiraceae bacterium]|nr:protein translocase subunit SecD [Oscillospiraceae bacterium]
MNSKKSVFFIVFFLILAFAASTVFGVRNQYGDVTTRYIKGLEDIRLGIDIQGGVDVTFGPADGTDATKEQLEAVERVMKDRLVNLGINDYEVYTDESNDKVIVRFPWQSGETNFDPTAAVKELGDTAKLQFRKGLVYTTDVNDRGETTVTPGGDIILEGTDVEEAYVSMETDGSGNRTGNYAVSLVLKESGKNAFAEATQAALNGDDEYLDVNGSNSNHVISIWMDTNCISYPSVNAVISDGHAQINGSFDYDGAKALADKINGGALPFNLTTESYKTISPSMGSGALKIMMISGSIALVLIMIYMIVLYRLPGFVAAIALLGQVAGTLAVISGWFAFEDSNTLTIPGIAGIILAIGMGVDCNIITGERIKEELNTGKSLDASLKSAYKRSFTSILDGNMTVIIVSIILMGAFGVSSSFFAKILSFLFRWFGVSTEGTIYAFGFTLLTGVIFNFIMGVLASRLMLTSLSKFKCFQNRKLYGGAEK